MDANQESARESEVSEGGEVKLYAVEVFSKETYDTIWSTSPMNLDDALVKEDELDIPLLDDPTMSTRVVLREDDGEDYFKRNT
jgi:hypothetical protein